MLVFSQISKKVSCPTIRVNEARFTTAINLAFTVTSFPRLICFSNFYDHCFGGLVWSKARPWPSKMDDEFVLIISPFFLQYSFFLMAILLVESTILAFGYYFREQITAGFHAAMSSGLQEYGKEPSLSSVIDDIQSTVSELISSVNSQFNKRSLTT